MHFVLAWTYGARATRGRDPCPSFVHVRRYTVSLSKHRRVNLWKRGKPCKTNGNDGFQDTLRVFWSENLGKTKEMQYFQDLPRRSWHGGFSRSPKEILKPKQCKTNENRQFPDLLRRSWNGNSVVRRGPHAKTIGRPIDSNGCHLLLKRTGTGTLCGLAFTVGTAG